MKTPGKVGCYRVNSIVVTAVVLCEHHPLTNNCGTSILQDWKYDIKMKLNIHAHIWNITAISDKHFQLSIHKSWVGIGQPRFVHATNYCIAQHSLCVWLSSDRRVHCVSKARVAPGVFRWKYIHSGHFCMFMVCTHKHDMHTCSLTGSRNFHPSTCCNQDLFHSVLCQGIGEGVWLFCPLVGKNLRSS